LLMGSIFLESSQRKVEGYEVDYIIYLDNYLS